MQPLSNGDKRGRARSLGMGFFLIVPREEAVELPIPIEEGLKLIVSGGAVVPMDRGQLGAALERLRRD